MSEPLLAYTSANTYSYKMNTTNKSSTFLDTINNSTRSNSSTPALYQSSHAISWNMETNTNSIPMCSTTCSSKTKHSPQSSTSFCSLTLDKSKSVTPNTNHKIKTTMHMIKPCPNMIRQKCQCKDILKQNKAARKIWSACYRINISNTNYKNDNRLIELAYFDGLYGKLSEFFQFEVKTNRILTKQELLLSIQYFGGFEISNNDIVIDKCHFILFWKWYYGVINIIKDLYNLWDTKFPFQLNLLMNRQNSDQILQSAPKGTVVLRISQSQINGLVLSYSDSTFNRVTKIKNLLLIRKSEQNYVTKTNHNSHKMCSLNQLIRSFVKLKYIYTPNFIFKKNHVF